MISFIIPVYNVEHFLPRTLDSVLNQSFHDFEVLTVNDGSTDRSLEILKQYASMDSRIRIIDKPNTGVSDTRNVGLKAANGDYVCFIDSDDILSPFFLQTLHDIATLKDADLVVCNYITFHSSLSFPAVDSQVTPVHGSEELVQAGVLTTACTKLIRKSVLYRNSIEFPSGMTFGEDLFFSWKALIASKNVWMTNQPLYGYRLSGSGAIMRFHPNLYDNYSRAFSELKGFAASNGRVDEIQAIDYFFTKRIPIFMMMTARQKSTLKEKIKRVKTILEDSVIKSVLNERWDTFTNELSANEESLYRNARNKKVMRLLLVGYLLDTRMKLSAIKGKLGGLHDS